MAPDTGAHLRINIARNVMYCLRCGYAGRWDNAIVLSDELMENAQAPISAAPDSALAETSNTEDMAESGASENLQVASPIEVPDPSAIIIAEVGLPGEVDECEELKAPEAGLIEDAAAEEAGEAREESVADYNDNEVSVMSTKRQPIVIEEFRSTGKETPTASNEEESERSDSVKSFASSIINIEKFPAVLASEDECAHSRPSLKAPGEAATAEQRSPIKIEEFPAGKVEIIPPAVVLASSAAEDVTGGSSGRKDESVTTEAAVDADDKAWKSDAVVINIEKFPASERKRRISTSDEKSQGFEAEEHSSRGIKENSALAAKEAPEPKEPYFAEHRVPYLHELDSSDMPEMEGEETLEGTDSAGFPEDFLYTKKKGRRDALSVEPGGNGAGVTPISAKVAVKREASGIDVAPAVSSPGTPPSKDNTPAVSPSVSSVTTTTRKTASWMAPPVNKAAPSSRMNRGEARCIILPSTPGAYVPPKAPSRMDSRIHIAPAPSSVSTKKKGSEWAHSVIFYLLIVCILAVAGLVAKPYLRDRFYVKNTDPTYIPFTSEKRALALSAAQDKPSEKDARALVELVQEAELRNAKLRAPEDYLVLSTDAWRGKNFHQALEDVFQGLALDHDDKKVKATLTLRLGTIYDDMKKSEMAIEQYNKASELDPDFSWPYYYLGNLYSKTGKFKLAERAYKRSIKLDSGYAYTYNNLGNLYSKMGEHRSAVDVYKEALKLDPDYANGYYNQGIIYGKMGLLTEAEQAYKEALRSDPKHAYALNNLGILYEKVGRTKEAEKSYKEALKIDPEHVNARFNLKKFYMKEDKSAKE